MIFIVEESLASPGSLDPTVNIKANPRVNTIGNLECGSAQLVLLMYRL